MTKTRSGDEEDNTPTPEKNIFDGKEYKWFELDELPNIPFNFDGIAYPKNKGILYNGFGFITPTYDTSEELDELMAEISDHVNLEVLLENTKGVNEMFANLGEVYGNKPKSLAHLMFNT